MSLTPLRKQIDEIDYQIHDLLNQRAALALQVGKIKLKQEGEHANFHRPERERQILDAITEYNKGPLSNDSIHLIFATIILECRKLQEKVTPQS